MLQVARRPGALAGLFAVAVTVGMAGGAAGALAGPAAPAAASVPGIETIFRMSATNSSDKTVTATCPKGKEVIDAGGQVVYGHGKVIMDDVFPDPGQKFVNVTGLETDDFDGYWAVVAYAVCANPLPGVEWIKVHTASDSSSTKTLTVECSPGKTVLGNGYAITGGNGEAWVDEAVPNGGPDAAATKVTLLGVEGDTYEGDWDLEGFLICADPLPGQRVLSASNTPSTNSDSAYTFCGGPEQTATGSTAKLHDGTGTVVLAGDFVEWGTTIAQGEVNDAPDGDWWLTTYAFCADV
jgi:hypothetical protein